MLNINYKHYQARLNTLGFSIKVLLRFLSYLIPIEVLLRLIDANTNHRFTAKYE